MEKQDLTKLEPPSKRAKTDMSPALQFQVLKQFGRCRASTITLPHGQVRAPVYMPVGTKGAMKALTSSTMAEEIDADIMLSNTYHLFLKPGEEVMEQQGGLHKFMKWPRNLLTDSGGFQIVSLGELNSIDEEGVEFQSHIDGRVFKLTPERSMEIQNCIGSDIMMALDDVVPPTTGQARVDEAMERSIRWLDRCIKAHKNPDKQNLFGIIQGGVVPELRIKCCTEMVKRDLPGYAIGGMAGGESKDEFWKTVKLCCELLPENKPRYVMGIGYAEDLMIASLMGADMFDCVFATRTARFGSAFSKYGMIKVKRDCYKDDFGPISEGCQCYACKNYTRSYIQRLMADKGDLSAI
jgi:queuine tRNA-ribosyltransferase